MVLDGQQTEHRNIKYCERVFLGAWAHHHIKVPRQKFRLTADADNRFNNGLTLAFNVG